MKHVAKWAVGALLSGVAIASCKTEEGPKTLEYIDTTVESADIPSTVPYNGGTYKLNFSTEINTRASEAVEPTFVPWQYRITVGENDPLTIVVDELVGEITFTIEPNYSETQRNITVEAAATTDENAVWKTIATSTQEAALVKVGEFFYFAKGSVVVRDGKFGLADKLTEVGYFFRNGSAYGVVPGEDYRGTAYAPEAKDIALSDIPYGDETVDPCSMISPNFRTPTIIELQDLFDAEALDNAIVERDGVRGVVYGAGKADDYFVPFGGFVSAVTGQIGYVGEYAALWGIGTDDTGDNLVYAVNREYSFVEFDHVGENLANIRCVKNLRQPSLVSMDKTSVTCAETSVHLVCDPGKFPVFDVTLYSSKGDMKTVTFTDKITEKDIIIPLNASKEDLTWTVYVNQIKTSNTIIQERIRNYTKVLSVHTDPDETSCDAFNLIVRVDTDLPTLKLGVKADDGFKTEKTFDGGEDVTLCLEIPANSSTESRKFTLYVNDKPVELKTDISQPGVNTKFNVIWSTGYLTINENGTYSFCEPMETGLYFKFGSEYGMKPEKYGVKEFAFAKAAVYGRNGVTTSYGSYAAVPYNETSTDPCAFVAPAGTWRLPSEADILDLIGEKSTVTKDPAKMFKSLTDGEQEVIFYISGQINKTGSAISLPTSNASMWTNIPGAKDGTYKYIMVGTGTDNKPSLAAGLVPETGMMIRCVRNR